MTRQMPDYTFWIYILASRSRNLYVGFTNDLSERMRQHREQRPGTHTVHYRIQRLVYEERFQYVRAAITRENELKTWTRNKKINLIEKTNPTWTDLTKDEEIHSLAPSPHPNGLANASPTPAGPH